MRFFYKILIVSVLVILSCESSQIKNIPPEKIGRWNNGIPVAAPDSKGHDVAIRIYFPANILTIPASPRVIIALHDYGDTSRDWEKYTNIEAQADKFNFVIVCPEMGNSVYASKFYPETKNKWNSIPGAVWVGEVLIPHLKRKYGLAKRRDHTAVVGVSDGAKGALNIAGYYPRVFGAAAGISGNYDTLVQTKNRKLENHYGKYKYFKERWHNDDNIIKLAEHFSNIPVFVGHGEKDDTVPVEHAHLLGIKFRQLQRENPGHYKFEYFEKPYKYHGWGAWKTFVNEMMSFMDKYLGEK